MDFLAGASLLGIVWIGKGVKLWKITGQGVMRAGEGPGEGFLMWCRALSNLEIQKYY